MSRESVSASITEEIFGVKAEGIRRLYDEALASREINILNNDASTLMHSFGWSSSPQGSEFWRLVHNKIESEGGYINEAVPD